MSAPEVRLTDHTLTIEPDKRGIVQMRYAVLVNLLRQAGWVEQPCPTCQGPNRQTVGMVCQTCGRDYGAGEP